MAQTVSSQSGEITSWQHGDRVVVTAGGNLPGRCARCGALATERFRRNVSWASRWFLLLLLLGLLPYILITLIFKRKSHVTVGLCDAHAARRSRDIRLGWIGLAVLVGSVVFVMSVPMWAFALGLLGIFILGLLGIFIGPALALYGYYGTRIVRATWIDGGFVWLAGVSSEIRAELPTFVPAKQ